MNNLLCLNRHPYQSNELYNEIKNLIIVTEKNDFKGIRNIGFANNYKSIFVYGSSFRLDNYNFICLTDTKLSTVNYKEYMNDIEEKRFNEELEKSKLIDSPEHSPQQSITR